MGSFPPGNSSSNNPQRRSQRIMLKTPVVILTRGDDNKLIWEETQTVTVNAHGAMVVSRLKLEVGQIVTLRNSKTEAEVSCRVVYISPHQTNNRKIGLEFVEPRPQFWHVSFPPADWTPKNPEAKCNTGRYSPSPTAKKKK